MGGFGSSPAVTAPCVCTIGWAACKQAPCAGPGASRSTRRSAVAPYIGTGAV